MGNAFSLEHQKKNSVRRSFGTSLPSRNSGVEVVTRTDPKGSWWAFAKLPTRGQSRKRHDEEYRAFHQFTLAKRAKIDSGCRKSHVEPGRITWPTDQGQDMLLVKRLEALVRRSVSGG